MARFSHLPIDNGHRPITIFHQPPSRSPIVRKLIGTLFLLSIVIAWFLAGVFDPQKAGAVAGGRVFQTLQLWFTFSDVPNVDEDSDSE